MSVHSFEEVIAPITRERFYDEFHGKKHFAVKCDKNRFKDHFSWEELDNYLNSGDLNQWDRLPQLAVILPEGNNLNPENSDMWTKRNHKKQFSKNLIFDLWSSGNSIVIPLSEHLNKTMWNQCVEFEKEFGQGCGNLYCSKLSESNNFKVHADSTDNFLFHVRGKIRWHIYNEFADECKPGEATLDTTIDLDEGDVLYIPIKLYHRVTTLSPRISISYHFTDKPSNRIGRWYDWIGEINGTTI
tara:strand:+ start:1230 stop:1958 length:729 start_codon:yes stop_codon:yes gene_type:complete